MERAESPHVFKLEDDMNDTYPRLSKGTRVQLPAYYPKYEEEFYDLMKDCARYIDKIHDVAVRIQYTNRLSKIFIIRHRGEGMKLFRELVTQAMKGR